MKRTDIMTNRNGLEFEAESQYVQGEWCLNEYNAAKMVVYANATELLPPEEEEKQIRQIMRCGVEAVLNRKGGDA